MSAARECTEHPRLPRIQCVNCGRLHPVVEPDGCIGYYDCVPGVTLSQLLEALEQAGYKPQTNV